MAIGSGVLLPGVAENPAFPILSALAYATALDYRPTCDIAAPYLSLQRESLTKSSNTMCFLTPIFTHSVFYYCKVFASPAAVRPRLAL